MMPAPRARNTEAAPAPPHPSRDRALILLVLGASSALSVALFAARALYSERATFFFLNWNLLLAWIPLVCAGTAWALQGRFERPRFRTLPFLGLWLLFFPNAPYILTDLLHLAQREGVPLWFDLLLLLSYAWNGLILGFVSLWIVQSLLQRWFGVIAGWIGAGVALCAGAFGIYLGRFERWNSWDMLLQPADRMRDLVEGLLYPMQHVKALAVTGLLAAILCAMYLAVALFSHARWDRH